MKPEPRLYGIVAEFADGDHLIEAARRAHEAGYRRMDAYSPYRLEELDHALHLKKTKVPLIVLIGGLVGCAGGYLLQYWTMAVDYPLNVGGRPLNSWPMYIPITFETTILVASLSAVLGMLALNGLPMPHHPLFNVKEFSHATYDRFFLCIESRDPKFDEQETRRFMESLEANAGVYDVPTR